MFFRRPVSHPPNPGMIMEEDDVSLAHGHDSLSFLSLVAQLSLEDVEEVQAGSKGKQRAGAPLSDEEFAFQLFAQGARDLLWSTKDAALAHSIDRALEADKALLDELARIEDGAREDYEFASCFAQGLPLPNRQSASTPSASSSVSSRPTLVRVDGLRQPTVTSTSNNKTTYQSTLNIKGTSKAPKIQEQCVFCRDLIEGIEIRAPCGHYWDTDCLVELFRAATTDETLYPPRCCSNPFVVDQVKHYFDADLLDLFNKKSIEFSIPDRVYCHRPTCSKFLGSATSSPTSITCTTCWIDTCGRCKQRAHSPGICATDDASILALADEAGWKRCPGCRHLVELTQGCYHMTCRCRKQFCYVCLETWKNCDCPQWDEARLYATAQDRVQRELPVGPRPEPVRFRELVTRAAERLRVDHVCQHLWRYRAGGGQCENCYHFLPQFLLNCRLCRMNVCVRCRRNRM